MGEYNDADLKAAYRWSNRIGAGLAVVLIAMFAYYGGWFYSALLLVPLLFFIYAERRV